MYNTFSCVTGGTERQTTAIEEVTIGDDWDLTLFTCTLGGQTGMTIRRESVEVDFSA